MTGGRLHETSELLEKRGSCEGGNLESSTHREISSLLIPAAL